MMGPCPTCGEHFVSRWVKKYCSIRCYHASDTWKANRAGGNKKTALRESRKCPQCGTEFEAKKSAPKKFCTRTCYRQWFADRHDRWIANPQTLALPQAYDEFLSMEELPCLFDDCDWVGHGLAMHVNLVHGVPAAEFKRLAGFNQNTGVVSPSAHLALAARSHIHAPRSEHMERLRGLKKRTRGATGVEKTALEGREHARKVLAERRLDERHSYVCVRCGTQFELDGIKTQAKYCSQECLSATHAERSAASTRRRIYKLTCTTCGVGFLGNLAQHLRAERGKPVVCSTKCKGTDEKVAALLASNERRKKPLPPRGPCPGCGQVFYKRGPPTTYCSIRCHHQSPEGRAAQLRASAAGAAKTRRAA